MVMADTEQVKEAAEVYIYGNPLVTNLYEIARFVEGGGSGDHSVIRRVAIAGLVPSPPGLSCGRPNRLGHTVSGRQ